MAIMSNGTYDETVDGVLDHSDKFTYIYIYTKRERERERTN